MRIIKIIAQKLIIVGIAVSLTACGGIATARAERRCGAGGPAGPRGERGPAGPAGGGIRIVRSNCDAAACTVQCEADEVLLNAYCGAAHNPAIFPSEKSASCRARGAANSPLIGACVKSSGAVKRVKAAGLFVRAEPARAHATASWLARGLRRQGHRYRSTRRCGRSA